MKLTDHQIDTITKDLKNVDYLKIAKQLKDHLSREARAGIATADGWPAGHGGRGNNSGLTSVEQAVEQRLFHKGSHDPHHEALTNALGNLVEAITNIRAIQNNLARLSALTGATVDNTRWCALLGKGHRADSKVDGKWVSRAVIDFHRDWKRLPTPEEIDRHLRSPGGRWRVKG